MVEKKVLGNPQICQKLPYMKEIYIYKNKAHECADDPETWNLLAEYQNSITDM